MPDESQRECGGCLCQDSPDEVLVLPSWPDAGHLHDEDAVVVEVVVDFAEEGVVSTDANVLRRVASVSAP